MFKPKIVQFNDGMFAIRCSFWRRLILCRWEYLARMEVYWWSIDHVDYCTYDSLKQTQSRLDHYKKNPKKPNDKPDYGPPIKLER